MSPSLTHRGEPEEVASQLAAAEELIADASEAIDDPFDRNRLKRAQFSLWEIRTALEE